MLDKWTSVLIDVSGCGHRHSTQHGPGVVTLGHLRAFIRAIVSTARLQAGVHLERLGEEPRENPDWFFKGSSGPNPSGCHRSINWHSFVYQARPVAGEVTERIRWPTHLQAKDRADIVSADQTKNLIDKCESASLSKMKELRGWNLGWWSMSFRRIVSQQRTGVLSYCTLKVILKRNRRMCPECKDDGSNQSTDLTSNQLNNQRTS